MQKPGEVIKKAFSRRRYRWLVLTVVLVLSVSVPLYFITVPPVLAQSAIYSLRDASPASKAQRVLVLAPHPDDETIGAGGFIAQSLQEGADIRVVLVTNGNYHHDEDLRYDEFRKAMAILGVPESNLVFLGFPDSQLRQMDQTVLADTLKRQIELDHPDILVYPCPQDTNPDHATVGRILEAIIPAESWKITAYEYLVHYDLLYPRPREYAPGLYLLPPKHLLKAYQWERFSLSQSIEDRKKEAIFTYRSQLENRWLHGILLSSIRKNELLAVPGSLSSQ